MNTPRHLSDAPADSGADRITAPRHADPKHSPNPYRDPWAGNPDTDKYWEKNR